MKITDVIVRKVYPDGKMRGIVSVTFDNTFVVHDIKVIQGKDGLFIAMPSRKMPTGGFKDICHPVNAEMRQEMLEQILAAYDRAVAGQQDLIIAE